MSFSSILTLKYDRKALSSFPCAKPMSFQSHQVKKQWFLSGPVTPCYFITPFDLDLIASEINESFGFDWDFCSRKWSSDPRQKNLPEVAPSCGLSGWDLSHLIMMEVSGLSYVSRILGANANLKNTVVKYRKWVTSSKRIFLYSQRTAHFLAVHCFDFVSSDEEGSLDRYTTTQELQEVIKT